MVLPASPPETFCGLAAEKAGIRFGTSKIVLDFSIVREGTLIFAVCNGILINLFQPRVEKLFRGIENLAIMSHKW